MAGVREDTGERVVALVGNGGYAEYALAPQERMFPLPDGLDDGSALAMIIQGTTAWHLYRTAARVAAGRERGGPQRRRAAWGRWRSSSARVFGAGRVIATASGEQRRALALELGADVAVDPAPEGLTREAAGGQRRREPVDVVFEMSGGEVFDASYSALAHFGRIVVYGISTQRAQRGHAPARCCATRGRWSASTCSTACERPGMFAEALADLFARAAAGELKVIVGATYPLAQAAPGPDRPARAAHDWQAAARPSV